jgi:hypothetical protein
MTQKMGREERIIENCLPLFKTGQKKEYQLFMQKGFVPE